MTRTERYCAHALRGEDSLMFIRDSGGEFKMTLCGTANHNQNYLAIFALEKGGRNYLMPVTYSLSSPSEEVDIDTGIQIYVKKDAERNARIRVVCHLAPDVFVRRVSSPPNRNP